MADGALEAVKDFVPVEKPSEAHRKQVGQSFFGTLLGQSVVLAGLLVAYAGALIALFTLSDQLDAFRRAVHPVLYWSLLLAPLAVIILFSLVPTALRARRERLLYLRSQVTGETTPGYFRLYPYGPEDRERFRRRDRALEDALTWLGGTGHSLLYLSGVSGAGKSSLVAAGIGPALEDQGWEVLPVRLIGDPEAALKRALDDGGHGRANGGGDDLTTMERLIRTARSRKRRRLAPLLIVVDQFEEFLILHKPEERQGFADVIQSLAADPLPEIRMLLVFRSDYREQIFKLALPTYRPWDNAFELAPYNRQEAEDFLTEGGRHLNPAGFDALFKGLDRIDDTRGLYRPVTLNMVGLVLARMGRQIDGDPGRLMETYLRDGLTSGAAQDHAKPLLGEMITPEGTKHPRALADLVQATGFADWQIHASLTDLQEKGLVRPLAGEAADDVWEISHDFLARLLGQLLGRIRAKPLTRSAPTVLALAATGWLVVMLIAVPYWLERSRAETFNMLAKMGVERLQEYDGGVGLGFSSSNGRPLTNAVLETIGDAAQALGNVHHLALSGLGGRYDSVDRLDPLAGLPLRSLALRDLDGITDLSPLAGLPLQTLELSYADGITDLSPLAGLPLQTLDLSGADGITDLSPLAGLPLQTLDLTNADGITDLSPLAGLPLQTLDLTNADGITDLSPLAGMTVEVRGRKDLPLPPGPTRARY